MQLSANLRAQNQNYQMEGSVFPHIKQPKQSSSAKKKKKKK